MAEYIEREAALSLVQPDAPEDEKAAVTIATAKKLVRSIVRRTPAADVAPVVRCKDCKYYCQEKINGVICRHPALDFDTECFDHWINTNPDDFCSYGERKDGDSDG